MGRTDGASLGAPGRFDALVETVEGGVLGDGFFDCACDHTESRFTIREQRRVGQQERREQEGQQRRGRTARKRTAAVQHAMPQ